MPSPATFTIPPIRRFIETWNTGGEIYDPFCGGSTIANHRNDIAITGIDSLDWLQEQPDKCADIFLNDPAYTPRQRKEVYKSLGITLHDTKASYWSKIRDEIVRIIKPSGTVLSFGYGASHVGKTRGLKIVDGLIVLPCDEVKGFGIVDGLMVLHGGNHNATICIAEKVGAP
ncbi:MAG: adenine-specific DNA methylase [Candidatus Micrarchaeia archaeon]